MKADQALKKWLTGTTCCHHKHKVFWESPDGRFFILKHVGHSSYIGRFGGVVWCETFYALYDGNQHLKLSYLPSEYYEEKTGCLHVWKGRFLKKYFKEVNKIIKNVKW